MDNEPKIENGPKLDMGKIDIAKIIIDNKLKIIIVASVALLVITAGIGFWYWSKNRQSQPSSIQQEVIPQEAPTLGSQIFENTQNPLKNKLPEVNPFKNQKNPLDVIYKNPFK